MFEHDCLDTCCFGCLICMCFVFLYLHLSVQLSMFHIERRSRNMLIIIIISAKDRKVRSSSESRTISWNRHATGKDKNIKRSTRRQGVEYVLLPLAFGEANLYQAYHYDSLKQFVCLLVGCWTSQQHAGVSQGRTCSDNLMCCHTEIEVADQTFHLTQSQYTDAGSTSPSTDPITPGAWQGSHWKANSKVTGMTRPRKNPSASGIRTWDLPLLGRTP